MDWTEQEQTEYVAKARSLEYQLEENNYAWKTQYMKGGY